MCLLMSCLVNVERLQPRKRGQRKGYANGAITVVTSSFGVGIAPSISVTLPPPEKQSANTQSDDDEEPPQISSEQLLRRASFK